MNYLQDIAKTPQVILVNQKSLVSVAAQCEFLGFWAKPRWYMTVDMLTVNRDSAISGFGFPGSEAASQRPEAAPQRPEDPKRRKRNFDG
jgi:hypothetical protein